MGDNFGYTGGHLVTIIILTSGRIPGKFLRSEISQQKTPGISFLSTIEYYWSLRNPVSFGFFWVLIPRLDKFHRE